jgi:CPA1 family monovalent cation:H+ antiporter
LATKIAGESLLNDGVGIVFFSTFLQLLETSSQGPTKNLAAFFLQQAGGGILLGCVIAYLGGLLLDNKPLSDKDNAKQDIYWSLCLVNATYLASVFLDVSPALACVAAGFTSACLLSDLQPSRATSLLSFWDIVDDILNTALFFLTGTYIFALDFTLHASFLAVLAIIVVLGSRVVSVVIPLRMLTRIKSHESFTIAFSGLKGGLSLALALSIPNSFSESSTVVMITFSVVAFTLLLQSSYVSWIVRQSPD